MLWKLITLVVYFALAESHRIEYGDTAKKLCILADIDTTNTLTRTDLKTNKTDNVPSYSLDNTTIIAGSCSNKARSVSLKWAEDDATIQFNFANDSGSVSMTLSFAFVPFKVWGSGPNASVTMESKLDVGHSDMAYLCHNPPTAHFSKDVNNISYAADWKFASIHLQAFDLDNNTYSADEECDADLSTTEAPTTEPTTNGTTDHTTEPTTNGTTDHTTEPTTNGTTEPTNGTTEHTTLPTTAPETTPTTPSATTEAPSAHPANTFTFNDTDHKNTVCVRLQAEISLHIPYEAKDGSSKAVDIGVPKGDEVMVSGSCNYTGMGEDMLELKFRDDWSLKFLFGKTGVGSMLQANDDDVKFWWQQVNLTFTYDDVLFPNINTSYVNTSMTISKDFSSAHQFEVSADGYYICGAKTTTDLGQSVQMDTWNLKYFAYENKTTFEENNNKISQCSADAKTNSVVPIAVGAALAGLVVIVLIAYLIGRRRNRKGYESV